MFYYGNITVDNPELYKHLASSLATLPTTPRMHTPTAACIPPHTRTYSPHTFPIGAWSCRRAAAPAPAPPSPLRLCALLGLLLPRVHTLPRSQKSWLTAPAR